MATTSASSDRFFMTSLINSLAMQTLDVPEKAKLSSNPLKYSLPATHKLLFTLHVLFPNEVLPALDVLDRQLVTRLQLKDAPARTRTVVEAGGSSGSSAIYLVRSAQQPSHSHSSNSRYTNPLNSQYEVRLRAWNCSCPAFAFSSISDDDAPATLHDHREDDRNFGGLSLMGNTGVCKHLLACLLVERCPGLFTQGVKTREVSKEEFAGWCAGWGD
jgi:hypothetical protein